MSSDSYRHRESFLYSLGHIQPLIMKKTMSSTGLCMIVFAEHRGQAAEESERVPGGGHIFLEGAVHRGDHSERR